MEGTMETLRKVVAGLVAITACLIYAHASHAVAPIQKGQVPDYYRMMLGRALAAAEA
jgi:hypothetical protein